MKTDETVAIRMFGMLHSLRVKKGLPPVIEISLGPEGKSAEDIARELDLPLDKIEAVFCNHRTYPLNHIIKPGDRVAFVPYGTPGPHRFCLGIKQAGDRSR